MFSMPEYGSPRPAPGGLPLPGPLRGVAYLAVCLVVHREKGLQECLLGGG